MNTEVPMNLYGYWRSSATWRVRWGFNLKKISYNYIPVNILSGDNKLAAHLARNPLGALPVLEIEPGAYLSESLAILEWLEDTQPYSGASLYPGSPRDKAYIRSLCEVINSDTGPLQTPRTQRRHSSSNDEKAKWAVDFIRQGLDMYEKISRPWRGTYSFGNSVTAADLCLVPQIYNALRYGINMTKDFSPLATIYDRAMQTPECFAAAPEQQIDAVK